MAPSPGPISGTLLLEAFRALSAAQPAAVALRWLDDGGKEVAALTYGEVRRVGLPRVVHHRSGNAASLVGPAYPALLFTPISSPHAEAGPLHSCSEYNTATEGC